MSRDIYGHDSVHPNVATSMSELAMVYLNQSRFKGLGRFIENRLATRQAIYGEEYAHPLIAKAVSDLRVEYRNQGKLEEAVKTHESSL